MDDLLIYFSGEKLYGDDFTYQQIKEWYEDEENGYADLGAKNKSSYQYAYHELNKFLGYKYLDKDKFDNVLGFGSAYGDELLPVIKKIKHVTILEPSNAFINKQIHGVPCEYVKPSIDGKLAFDNNKFDLITCFGVLHHVPNVSMVVQEMKRVIRDDGYILIREPVTSMGDWRRPRSGLTKRERGIPVDIFDKIISDAGLIKVAKTYCVFPIVPKLCNKLNISAYNSLIAVIVDKFICSLFSGSPKYHAETTVDKIRPTSAFYVLKKK